MSDERQFLIPESNNTYGSASPDAETSETFDSIGITNNTYIPAVSFVSDQHSLDTPQSTASTSCSSLSGWSKFGFGLGHVYNDLCAGIWFSYTLLFLQNAIMIPGPQAGALIMLGQVGDAMATPLIGYLADKFGTKQKWHAFGTAMVFFSFPLIFSLCPSCKLLGGWWRLAYFAMVILSFQLGWAIVQVTHLAIIPEMSRTQKDRSELTAIRYSASIVSSIIVFVVTWAVLRADRVKGSSNIGPDDAYRFRDISLILTLLGISMTVAFHFALSWSGYGLRRAQALNRMRRASSVSQKPHVESGADQTPRPRLIRPPRGPKNFFKSWRLYQNTFLYVFSRLFMTTALVYIPLWLNERLITPSKVGGVIEDSDKSVEHIATVPLVSFLSSFVSSMLMKYSHRVCNHQVAFLIGSVISIGACLLVALVATPSSPSYLLFIIAMFFGAGSSVTMISSLCIIADMIGKHADQSGFIYSAVTFADKLITGIAVIVIESLKCQSPDKCPEYYKTVLAYGCGGAAILGIVILITLLFNRKQRPRTPASQR